MKRLLRNTAQNILNVVLRPVYAGIGCIFSMHRVAEKTDTPRVGNTALEISPAGLDSLIQHLLSRDYQIVSMDEVHAILTTRKKTKRFAALTFDDGYLDNYTLARPVFKKYDAPFSVNIATSLVGDTNAFWWYRLEHLLLQRDTLAFSNQGQRHELDVRSHSQKESAFELVAAIIRGAAPRERGIFLQEFFAQENDFQKTNIVMDWEQIKELANDSKVTIGSHSVNHYDLNRLTDAEILFELNESRRIIESKISRKVEHFAYPFGGRNAVNEREFAISKTAGYKTMLTTRKGNIFPAHAQYLECLPRIGVGNNYPVIQRFKALESGVLTARANRFKRVVTV